MSKILFKDTAITSHLVFCSVKEAAFLAEEMLQNPHAASKHLIDATGVANFWFHCVYKYLPSVNLQAYDPSVCV
jgi:hypothetical protein